MAATLGAGEEVLSYCNKCKLTLAHTILAMKDAKTIQKVKCKTCGSTHAFKDPSTAGKKKSTGPRTRKTTKSVNVSELWMEQMAKTQAKSREFSIRTKFELGDVIDHKKFGPGIVQTVLDGNKIEVLFRHEIKTLVHNK